MILDNFFLAFPYYTKVSFLCFTLCTGKVSNSKLESSPKTSKPNFIGLQHIENQ